MNRASALICAACVVAVLAGCGTSTPSHHTGPSSPSTSAPAPAVTSSAANPAAEVQSWDAGSGGAALRRLGRDFTAFADAAHAVNIPATARACRHLGAAAEDALAAPPIPYPPSERWYRRALAEYTRAAADCQAGSASLSASMINQATSAIEAGNSDLGRATAAIKQLG